MWAAHVCWALALCFGVLDRMHVQLQVEDLSAGMAVATSWVARWHFTLVAPGLRLQWSAAAAPALQLTYRASQALLYTT